MKSPDNYPSLKKICNNLGIDVFGVADISKIKNEFMLSGRLIDTFDKAIVLGARLSWAVLEEIETHPTKLYFHHYRTLNVFLDQLALRLSVLIQAKGFVAIPIPASQIVDWQNQLAHLSHKKIAQLAGVGWIGRNNLLVTREFGSQLRLVSILTDMPLTIDSSLEEDCGSCRMCVSACPASAIKDTPHEFDHQKCFEKLKEFQKQRLVDQYICGVCVNACRGKG